MMVVALEEVRKETKLRGVVRTVAPNDGIQALLKSAGLAIKLGSMFDSRPVEGA